MLNEGNGHFRACEMLLAKAMTETAAEVRMIEPVDLVANIHHERTGHVRDLVESAAELFFKPGTVSICGAGSVRLGWETPVAICFHMEFRNRGVGAYFRLWVSAGEIGVQLDLLDAFRNQTATAETVQQFSAVLDDARLHLPLRAVHACHRALLTTSAIRQCNDAVASVPSKSRQYLP